MLKAKTERRLAAVLAADVVGYTRLMGSDEAGTHARLKAIRRELVDSAVKKHCGRVVKSTGDGVLVEFPSAVEAAACAVEVQRAMLDRNAKVPEDKQIVFRVGLNVGDLIIDDGDIFGDGVNVAARLESLCVPGGICISRAVRDQIRDKGVPYIFDDLGEQPIKNIARPVRAFQIRLDALGSDATESETDEPPPPLSASRRWPLWKVGIGAAVVVAALTATMWWSVRHDEPKQGASTVAGSVTALPAGAVPGGTSPTAPRLSIVVLPFANLNQDAEQDYFADAVVGDLTSDLSRISGSFVIARNTAFTYKGKSVDIKQVGRDLGIRYALEGSVQRVGDKVRVNAELIDAQTGGHLWADRFEGDMARLVKLQDEFTGRLARSLNLELIDIEGRRTLSKRPENLDAVDLTMRGWSAWNGAGLSREPLQSALQFFEQALRIDPEQTDALIGLGLTTASLVRYRLIEPDEQVLSRADNAVARALSREPAQAMAHFAKGELLRARKRFDEAIAEYDTATALNSNLAPAYAYRGQSKLLAGRAAETFLDVDAAIRLSPRDPSLNLWLFFKCHAFAHLANDDDAIEWCRKSVALRPFWISYIDLISAYGWTGRREEAHAAIIELHKLMPGYTVKKWANAGWSDNPIFLAEYARIVEGLRKGGLPEE